MNPELLKTCELFIRNLDTLREALKWEGDAVRMMGSAVLTSRSCEPDAARIIECETILKERAGLFSPLRGTLKTAIVCRMAMQDDPAEYFDNVQRAYELIRITRRSRDDRYYLAAMMMAETVSEKDELLGLIDTANELYSAMKSSDGLFEDRSGYLTAAAAACVGTDDIEELIRETEACRDILERDFGQGGPVNELALMLALDKSSSEPALKCARLREIVKKLEEQGVRFAAGDELPVLGTLAMLEITNADAAAYVLEADAYLRSQRGFGFMGCSPAMRHMYAAMLVAEAYVSEVSAGQAAEAAALESAIRAQYAAMDTDMLTMTMNINMMIQNGIIMNRENGR